MDKTKIQENRERLNALCSPKTAEQFREKNKSLKYFQSATCRDSVYNAADKDYLEYRKKELGLTNSDILMIFNNLLGRVITDATLRRKMSGKSDFTASEIMALALILDMTPNDVLECFHLYPNM